MSKRVLGRFFRKYFLPSVPWSHRKFSKKPKKFQNWRNAQNCSQNCPNLFWTCFVAIFPKKCLVFHGGSGFRNFSKESKNFQNSKIAQSRFQKCPNVLWTCFDAILPNFFAQCSMQGFSDFLDLKIWGQFSGLKKFEFGFPDLKFEVDT